MWYFQELWNTDDQNIPEHPQNPEHRKENPEHPQKPGTPQENQEHLPKNLEQRKISLKNRNNLKYLNTRFLIISTIQKATKL